METLDFAPPIIGVAVGFALGAYYFSSLLRSIENYLKDGSAARALLRTFLRFGAAFAVFWLLAQWNAIALIAGLGGFMLARYRAQKDQVKTNA